MGRAESCGTCEWWVANRLHMVGEPEPKEQDTGACHLMPEIQQKARESYCSAWQRRMPGMEEVLGEEDDGRRSDVDAKGRAAVESLADPDDGHVTA